MLWESFPCTRSCLSNQTLLVRLYCQFYVSRDEAKTIAVGRSVIPRFWSHFCMGCPEVIIKVARKENCRENAAEPIFLQKTTPSSEFFLKVRVNLRVFGGMQQALKQPAFWPISTSSSSCKNVYRSFCAKSKGRMFVPIKRQSQVFVVLRDCYLLASKKNVVDNNGGFACTFETNDALSGALIALLLT